MQWHTPLAIITALAMLPGTNERVKELIDSVAGSL